MIDLNYMTMAKPGMTNVYSWVYGYNTRLKQQKPIMGCYCKFLLKLRVTTQYSDGNQPCRCKQPLFAFACCITCSV